MPQIRPWAAEAVVCTLFVCGGAAAADPVRSSVRIDVTRDDGAVFAGYKLQRAGAGMGVITGASEIATAAHVVWRARSITVTNAQGTRTQARVEHIDAEVDAALLRIDRRLGPAATVRVRPAVTGERVAAPGLRSADEPQNLIEGTVWATRWRSHGVAVPLVLTSIRGEKGMSGGGLFDERGHLIGIVSRIDRTLGYLSALPVEHLCARLARCALAADEAQ